VSKVYYLCSNPKERASFVFATELGRDLYVPGIFAVEAFTASGKFAESYSFLARQGDTYIRLQLIQKSARVYSVDAGSFGLFWFKLIRINRYFRYKGAHKTLFNNKPLARVEPANMTRLERVCIAHDFYFVGANNNPEREQQAQK
jgi:hypothetical protein